MTAIREPRETWKVMSEIWGFAVPGYWNFILLTRTMALSLGLDAFEETWLGELE